MKYKSRLNKAHNLPGTLICVEGIDGSGKSTQLVILRDWLKSLKQDVIFTEWNSSDLISQTTKLAKKKNLLSPRTFSLLHAVDFADRLEQVIIPALKAGFVVILDRYVYTAYARDVVRGHNIEWLKNLYDYAPEPDMVFYLDVPVEILLKRIIGTTGLDYWESGRDIGLSTDFYKSFQIYQGKCLDAYQKMIDEYGFISIDGTKSPKEIHKKITSHVGDLLENLD